MFRCCDTATEEQDNLREGWTGAFAVHTKGKATSRMEIGERFF